MGTVANEKGVLKLVYPGRYVEIHTEPIRAAEVLKKNPRHSITRPDVFKYHWIVVKPDSVLELGGVFFVVPNQTIYNLLKAHMERHQQDYSASLIQAPKKNCVQRQVQMQYSQHKSDAGMTNPEHVSNHRWPKN